jgi:hypothetical protein
MTSDQLQQWITRTGGDPEKVRTLLANVLAEVVPAQEPLPPSDKLFHYTEAKIHNKVVQTIWQRATDLSIPGLLTSTLGKKLIESSSQIKQLVLRI